MRPLHPINVVRWLFDGRRSPHGRLIPRWIFLRALALIYFSAFYSLLFQIKGLIGPEGILPARRFPAGCGRTDGPDPLLVRADALLVFQQLCGADDDYVGRACGVGDRVSESLAAALFFRVFPLLPFVHRRVECVLELSIGWHVARGGIHRAVFCSARIDAGMGRARSAIAREPVPAAMGVVPDLLRIGHGEAAERRRGVAQLYSDGRVLPERPAAHLGRLVRATPAALVPRSKCWSHAGCSNWGSSS